MPILVQDLILKSAQCYAENEAISDRRVTLTYAELTGWITRFGKALSAIGLRKQERVAVYLPKQIETVIAFFGINVAGAVFVPVNPVFKAPQVQHILNDCNVKVLVTSKHRVKTLENALNQCPDLDTVIVVEDEYSGSICKRIRFVDWNEINQGTSSETLPTVIDSDMAGILYTSGSTGKPKGVVLSHKNIVTGAKSVAEYLEICSQDRILAALPFSFDYGLNQLTSSLLSGACCVLMDYLLPRDVLTAVVKERITGLAAVPPLWVQLGQFDWPETINNSLRYMTNSGGKMPKATLNQLRKNVPNAKFYLMYGLTEAFRSTYLPPDLIDQKPDSIGKAIPNAEIVVVKKDGTPCGPHEPGELVHRGSLVAMGYWNNEVKTNERFKPSPTQIDGITVPEITVWSGDTVTIDEEGFLYFIGRQDDMIKTSGYRVSPTEVEEVIYANNQVKEAAVVGVFHPQLGQAIVVAMTAADDSDTVDQQVIIADCKKNLPNFMVPLHIEIMESLPKNPNGKIDRKTICQQLSDLFAEAGNE